MTAKPSPEEKEKLLTGCELFKPLSAERQLDLFDAFEWVALEDGKEVIHEGEMADFLIVVVSGVLEVYKKGAGSRQLLGFAREGTVLGEMGLISNERRYASCRSVEQTRVGLLSYDKFDQIKISNPYLYIDLLTSLSKGMCRRLRSTSDLVANLKKRNEIAFKAAEQILEAALDA
jgi:CRP-like cAMP-binding protein